MSRKSKYGYRSTNNATDLIGDRCYYDIESIIKNRLQCAPQFVQRLELDKVLEGHSGCVNCLEWTTNGRILASASDDCRVMLWDPFKRKNILDFHTPHRGNIFSVKFLPNTDNSVIATGAADGEIFLFDITQDIEMAPIWKCKCHYSRVKRLATTADSPFLFWSAAEDGIVLQFDRREKHKCRGDDKVLLIGLQNHMGANAEAKCVTINQRRPELIAIGANDVYARVYDRRMISLSPINYKTYNESLNDHSEPLTDNIPKIGKEGCVTYYCPGHLNKFKDKKTAFSNKAITYLTFSPNGNELLVNMGAEQIYLYDVINAKEPEFFSLPQFKKSKEPRQKNGKKTPQQPNDINYAASTSTDTEPQTFISMKTKLPEHVEAMKRLGNDFLEKDKCLYAIEQYTRAINILPNHPVFYLNRATAYMRRNYYGDVYAALRDCLTALKLDPTYVKAHFRMARALFQLDYVQEAKECVEELENRFKSHATNSGIMLLKRDIQNSIEQGRHESFSLMQESDMSANEMYWRSRTLDYSERFVGHCNTTTDIKEANFFGNDTNYVIAGSDDGNFFIWERPTGVITNIYKADSNIVNCVQPHPYFCLVATSGIDHEIRLWAPQAEEEYEPKNKIANIEEIVIKNHQHMQSDPFELGSSQICRSS